MEKTREGTQATGVGALCTRDVVIVRPEETARTVSRLMREFGVGSVVVVEGGRPVGILTDRDLAVRMVAEARVPDETAARDVMSSPVVTISEDAGVGDALRRMRSRGIRRLPVVDVSGSLVGILSMNDLLDLIAEELESMARLIRVRQEGMPGKE